MAQSIVAVPGPATENWSEEDLRITISAKLSEIREVYALACKLELSDATERREAERLTSSILELSDEVCTLVPKLAMFSEASRAVAEATETALSVLGDGLVVLLARHDVN